MLYLHLNKQQHYEEIYQMASKDFQSRNHD